MIAIIDYGLGNLGSVQNILKKVGCSDSIITLSPEAIANADKIILPGVGSFDNGMTQLKNLGLIEILNQEVLKNSKPILGICLGMQLMTQSSEEGILPGLGFFEATTEKFKFDKNSENLKIPHMGWNEVYIKHQNPLLSNFKEENRFYFVHSYYVKCKDKGDELLSCNYGFEFTCGIQKDNIYGVQFHPEKSHRFGMQLMKNFVEL
jgi:glutamine amidotransferase